MEVSNLTPESTLRRIFICVVEYGQPRYRLWAWLSPRETVIRKEAVSKVVPRNVYSSLKCKNFKDFLFSKRNKEDYHEPNQNQ